MRFDFDKSFSVYSKDDVSRQFPTEWLYSNELSSDTEAHFLAYDANLYPAPNIATWNADAIGETCKTVVQRFKGSEQSIFLDGNLLDKDGVKLIIK